MGRRLRPASLYPHARAGVLVPAPSRSRCAAADEEVRRAIGFDAVLG